MNKQYIKPENIEPLDNLPSDFNWETYIELNEDGKYVSGIFDTISNARLNSFTH